MVGVSVFQKLLITTPRCFARSAAGTTRPFCTPTSTEQRMKDVGRIASGYVYYVSLKGVTGAGHLDIGAGEAMLPRIREHVRVPVGVGFGIRNAATAKAVAAVSDAVVIGSALVQLLESEAPGQAPAVAGRFIAGIRTALDTLTGEHA